VKRRKRRPKWVQQHIKERKRDESSKTSSKIKIQVDKKVYFPENPNATRE
jgi:osmotically-inducible protein OsmY